MTMFFSVEKTNKKTKTIFIFFSTYSAVKELPEDVTKKSGPCFHNEEKYASLASRSPHRCIQRTEATILTKCKQVVSTQWPGLIKTSFGSNKCNDSPNSGQKFLL